MQVRSDAMTTTFGVIVDLQSHNLYVSFTDTLLRR